jgi:hypothetical protein
MTENKAVTYEQKWKMLKECLKSEVKLAENALKEALKGEYYTEANNINENLATVTWVIEEIDSIERNGECL